MDWLGQISTRTRLLSALAGIILSLCLVVGLAIYSMETLERMFQNTMEHDFQSAMDSFLTRIYNNRVRAEIFTMIDTDDQAQRAKQESLIKADGQVIQNHYSDLKKRFADDQKTLDEITTAQGATKDYLETSMQEIIPLLHDGKVNEAKKMVVGVQAQRYKVMRDICEAIGNKEAKAAKDSLVQVGDQIKGFTTMFTAIGFIAIVMSMALGFLINMTVKKLTTATSRIRQAAEVLGTSVHEILASLNETSSGTAQTAAAVSETSATVEEVRRTSELATQRAQGVSDRAQKSARISEAGRQATDESVQGMQRIKSQMESIANSMQQLSARSESISQIISSVDDLARQSNLLSVNASIEAAKAGDVGKGFAVVAQEVKDMANQSREATAQVRAILTEIQVAASAAATATAQGTRAVADALGQSSHAGQSIEELAQSVSDSAEAAAEIAISSQQQLAGVDMLATAMDGIKSATAQNVTSISQVQDAVNNLSELGQELRALTSTLGSA